MSVGFGLNISGGVEILELNPGGMLGRFDMTSTRGPWFRQVGSLGLSAQPSL